MIGFLFMYFTIMHGCEQSRISRRHSFSRQPVCDGTPPSMAASKECLNLDKCSQMVADHRGINVCKTVVIPYNILI